MAYAEKRGRHLTGYWYGEVHHKKNGRFRRRFKVKDVADSYEAHVKAFGEEPEWAKAEEATEAGRTFAAVAAELKAAGGPEGTWARGKDVSVIQRLDFVCDSKVGKMAIDHVNYTLAEEFVGLLKKRPGQGKDTKLSAHTINRYLTAISSVLTYAEKKDYITRSPHLPWQKAVKKKKYIYTETQERAVVNKLRSSGYDVEAFLLGVLTRGGLRIGELLGLKPEQIEDEFINLDDPEEIKNEETRLVYIGCENADKLRALVAGGSMPSYHTFYMHLRSAIETCGYEIKRPLHALRHTAATRTIDKEQDIQVAKELLGHKSINTTLGYRHVSRAVLLERAKKLHPQRGNEAQEDALPEIVAFKKPA